MALCVLRSTLATRSARLGAAAVRGLASKSSVDVDEAGFKAEVLEADKPVIVDFYADWCGPCRLLGPVLERVVEGTQGAVLLKKVDVDQNPVLSQQHKVSSIPLVLAYHKGKIVDQFSGARDKAFVANFVDKVMKLPAQQKILQEKLNKGA